MAGGMACEAQKWYNIAQLQEGVVPIEEIDTGCRPLCRGNGDARAVKDAFVRYSAAYPTGAERCRYRGERVKSWMSETG